MAKIIMVMEDGSEWPYGTYPFETAEEKNRVNELALKIRRERGVHTYVLKVRED